MAINEQAFNPQAPAFARSSPRAYYAWLTSNGFPHRVAYDQTTAIFGPPKTPEQQQAEAAKQKQNAGLAQAGGAIGGALITNEAIRGFPNVRGAFDSTTQPTSTSAESGNLAISRPVPPPTTTIDGSGTSVDLGGANATPKVISTEGGMSTVETPAGTQQVPTESLNDSGFWSNVNWGQVAQGGLALAQMYSAYQAYKSGDKTGAAVQGLAGAGNLAAATGAVATGTAAGTTGAYVIPGLNIVAGAYGGYQTAEAMSDMAAGNQRNRAGVVGGATSGAAIGAGVGSIVPGVGTAIGAGVGAVVGAIAGAAGSYFGSSKGKGQMQRDAVRGVLQKQGILDENYQGTLADGTKTDFGQDGSKINTKFMNKLAFENPTTFNQTQELGDALTAAYGFVGDKARSLGRLYVKGALSNAKDNPQVAIANMQHFAKQQGITYDLIKGKLDEALKDSRINQGEYGRLLGSAQTLAMGAASDSTPIVPRPEKGQVARQSAGLYRNDQGKLVQATSMRSALKKSYSKTKENKEKK
jgi:hypothetical protein